LLLLVVFSDRLSKESRRKIDELFHDSEDVVFADDQVFSTVDGDFRAAVFAEQNHVTLLYVQGSYRAVFGDATVAYCNDLTFLRLFFGAVGNDDPAFRLLFLVDALDENAILEWTNLHESEFLLSF